MKKIFLDANVFIDMFSDRNSGSDYLADLLLASTPPQLCMSTLSVHISFYVSKVKKGSRDYSRIESLLKIIDLVPLDEKMVLKALDIGFADFEDTLQYLSAIKECDYLLTRDLKHFKKLKELAPSKIQIISSLNGVL